MLRSALLVLSGNAAASLLLLARNLIVARMIPVADYGIAATFALAMAVVEMASAFGLQQQIVQSKKGDDPHFQAALQGFQLLRGLASGVILFLLAAPLAHFMAIPEVIWAYQVLAIVPVLNAVVHFDIYRLNRQMRFWPLMLTGGVPALLSLLAVWPLAHWFGDWRVMLYAILLQAAIAALTSHLVAERRWKIVFDRAIIAGSLRFGWPLLVNAILMFLVFQGDKLIVGRELGMEALAIFAMGMTLTLTPTLVMAKSVQNLFLPKLSRLQAEGQATRHAFQRHSYAMLQAAVLNGAIVILLINLAGGWLISVLFGGKYDALLPLLTAFGLLNGLRVFKAGPAVIALSCGHTANSMLANLPRLAVLPLAWVMIRDGGSLQTVLWLGIMAEAVGFVLALVLVRLRPGLPLHRLWKMALGLLAFILTNIGVPLIATASTPWIPGLIQLLGFGLLAISMRELWSILLKRNGHSGAPPR